MADTKPTIEIKQGSVFEWLIGYDDSDGVLVDLEGYSARMQVRERPSSTDTILSLTDGEGIEFGEWTADTDDGDETFNIRVTVGAETTADLPSRVSSLAYYDLEVLPNGDEDQAVRLVEGRAKISPEVTR